jgi:hypothetical protein
MVAGMVVVLLAVVEPLTDARHGEWEELAHLSAGAIQEYDGVTSWWIQIRC